MRCQYILFVIVILLFLYGEVLYNAPRVGGGVTPTWYSSNMRPNSIISSPLTNNSVTTREGTMPSTAAHIGTSTAIMRENGQCRLLPRGSPSGTVEICLDRERRRGCRGAVKVTIPNCLFNFTGGNISNNATLSEELKSLGPDTIRVRLSGPEVVAGIAALTPPTPKEVVHSCVYEYHFVVYTEGKYNIAAERLYANYDALNEVFDIWPPLIKEPLLKVNVKRNNYHYDTRTLESHEFLTCDGLTANTTRTASVTACTGLEKSTDGQWVKDPSDIVYSRIIVRRVKRHPWELQNDSLYQWVPHECTKDGVSFSDFNQRFRGKRILVIGDSQLRSLYFGLSNVLRGNGVACVQNVTTRDHKPDKCIYEVDQNYKNVIPDSNIKLRYDKDFFLENFQNMTFDKYDIIIVGLAQHPASGAHWPLDRYRDTVSRISQIIESLRRRNKTVVWYLTTQFPHRKTGDTVTKRDWRTDPRLKMFNGYAKGVFLSRGVPVVDGFSISTGMSHTSHDSSHFDNFVCFEIVHMLLSVLVSTLEK